MNKIKNIALAILFIIALGLLGRMECQDEIKSAEYDEQIKQEVIKDWQIRCSTGDIFDTDICKAIVK